MVNAPHVKPIEVIESPRSNGDAPSWSWSDWVSPRHRNDLRTAGHHALQIAVDTIAYSQNVPVRLLLVDSLRRLPQLIAGVLDDGDVRAVLRANVPKLDAGHYGSLADEALLIGASDWILSLTQTKGPSSFRVEPDNDNGPVERR